MGATGSGKTTLLQHLNGLLKPSRGTIYIDSIDILNSNAPADRIRKNIGIVFQFPEMQFFEESVFKDVAYGPRNLGLDSKEVLKRVKDSLKAVGLEYEHYYKRSPFHLSSGEQRRLAIACILALDPELLILDEPTIGLDWLSSKKIENIIIDFHKKGRSVIFVTHDINFVSRIAEQIIILDHGKVVFDGSKETLFNNEKILRDYNLPYPEIMAFMIRLRKQGIPVNNNVYSIDEAKEEINNILADEEHRKSLKNYLFLSG